MPDWINANAGLFTFIVAALVVLLWRQMGIMESLSGAGMRAKDRERHDNHQLIQTLMEKLFARNAFDMARLHSIERLRTNQIDENTEKQAVRSGNESVDAPQESQYCDEQSYEN